MIKITPKGISVPASHKEPANPGRKGVPGFLFAITRYLRAINAERYIAHEEKLLDIGCGDGYFIRRSPCSERYGLDRCWGDEVKDSLDFPDSYFDYVTMLAFIEHVKNPDPLVAEVYRVLKPEGKLVITTPKKQAEFLIRLYVRDIDEEHSSYHDLDSISRLAGSRFRLTGYHTFIFGLNQVFCLEKIV